jgi:serine/threonine protein kinase
MLKMHQAAKRVFEVPHPNIIRARDHFTKNDEEEEQLYTVYEYADGGTLEDLIRKRVALPEKECLYYFA